MLNVVRGTLSIDTFAKQSNVSREDDDDALPFVFSYAYCSHVCAGWGGRVVG